MVNGILFLCTIIFDICELAKPPTITNTINLLQLSMEAHIFFFCTSTILTISFFLIISLPKSYSENHDDAYHECGRPYNCGTIQMPNGAYPFWTDDRPRYCGSTDGLKLNCSENHSVSFEVGTQIFNVTQINQEHHILTVVRADVDYDNCSSDLTNVSFSLTSQINLSIFGSVKNVTLFYDCPSSISGLNKFPCKAPSNSNIYYAFENDAEYGVLRSQCGRLIQVPISSDGIDLNIAQDGIVVLNRGFDVTYMSVDESPCLNCAYSRGICGSGIDNSSQFTCFCEDGPQNSECHHHHSTIAVRNKVIVGITVGVVVATLIFCCMKFKSLIRKIELWKTTKPHQEIEAFIRNHGSLALTRYKFSDVKKMTKSFKVKLGEGGYGAVYKGELLNGSHVAVKILTASKGNGQDFINEVASISRTSHVNVVSLLGFCLEGQNKALIYEFMPNGSLDRFIDNKVNESTPLSLTLENLYEIAIGIARGLEYLHRGCKTRILHFDIKPHNILLDENFCPKISDFGLAKICPRKESIISISEARGTIGYVAPEIWNRNFGGVSHKSDVYSYGMMLLDIVGERKNMNAEASCTSEKYFPDWIYSKLEEGSSLVPNGMTSIEEHDIAKRMIVVGLWCIQAFPIHRPTISRVIEMLEGSLDSLEIPPKPVMSSPTRIEAEFSTTTTC